MMNRWVDGYDLKARIVPGLILVFPVILDALYAAPVLNSWSLFTVSGLSCFELVYALGQLARAQGERIEARLWKGWGGPPSTRFMRLNDGFFGLNLKMVLREMLQKRFGVRLLTADAEADDSAAADKEIEDAFRRVRAYLRQHDPRGLWHTQNIEYGFSRNLLGSRWVWAIVSGAAAAFAVAYGMHVHKGGLNPASLLAALWLGCAIYVGWGVLPDATKRVADGYADAAWLAFWRIEQSTTPQVEHEAIRRDL